MSSISLEEEKVDPNIFYKVTMKGRLRLETVSLREARAYVARERTRSKVPLEIEEVDKSITKKSA